MVRVVTADRSRATIVQDGGRSHRLIDGHRAGQLAQLVRALRSHRRGHRFESCAAHLANPDRAADSAPLVETFGFEPPCDRVAEVCVANLEVGSAELVGECPSHLVQMWAG